MKFGDKMLGLILPVLLAASLPGASAATRSGRVVVPKDTTVILTFDQSLNSKTAKGGDKVRLSVKRDVDIDGRVIIRHGTPVIGILSDVHKRKRYGINATLRLALRPVQATNGQFVNLEPQNQGKVVGGKTGAAAAATVGGAALLGPIGLVGGYFTHGKSVKIKPGDEMITKVSRSALLQGARRK